MLAISYKNYLRVAAASLLASAAAELHSSEDTVDRCARIASPDERILCLESALRSVSGDSEESEYPETNASGGHETASIPEEIVDAEVAATSRASDTRDSETAQYGPTASQIDADPVTSIDVAIIAISKNAYGKLVFSTDNGQVWQQIDRRTPRYKELPFDATIRNGGAGSHFIQPREGGGIAVRVRRKK